MSASFDLHPPNSTDLSMVPHSVRDARDFLRSLEPDLTATPVNPVAVGTRKSASLRSVL